MENADASAMPPTKKSEPIAASRPHISSSQSFCKQMLAADAPKSIEA
jgi:hypothetical protein